MTALGFFASTGLAAAACQTQSTTTPFAQFGDSSSYFLAPGGSFEGSALPASWTVSGASLVPGNEPFKASSASDGQSLQINAGGSVTTDYICVDETITSFRFFAKEASPGSDLKVTLLLKLPNGFVVRAPVARLADGSYASWAPTSKISPAGAGAPGVQIAAALRFSVPAGATSTASWQIDDLFVDPYRVA